MVELVRLSPTDYRLLCARAAEHGNSHKRMAGALAEAGATDALERLRALRRLEHRFAVDLGSLCHRFERRAESATHPIERKVLGWVAERRLTPDGAQELWVFLDRLRQIRGLLLEGELARELE